MIFECNVKPVLDDKASVFEKSKTINLNLPTFDESKLICANACTKNCNHINAWFECNHTMCIESAKYCGQCIECGKKPTDMRQWLNEIPTFDETKIPTELRQWLKDQMREIENKTLDEDKTKKILDMLDEWKHTGHADECSKIIDELKEEKTVVIRVNSTRIKQLELLNKKNKQLEEQNKQLEEQKQVFLEGYKRTLEQLNIKRTENTNLKLDIISMRMRAEKAEDKIEELNKVIERLLSKMDDLKLEISDVEDD